MIIYIYMHIIMINEPNNNESKIQNTPTLGPLAPWPIMASTC